MVSICSFSSRSLRLSLMITVAAICAPPASASIVIDFEQFSATIGNITELSFTQGGVDVRIYRPDNTSFTLAKVDDFLFGEVSLSPFNGDGGAGVNSPFVIEFSVPIQSFIVTMGDWGEDADSLLLVGYEGPGLTGASASTSGELPIGPNTVFTSDTLVLRTPAHIAGFRSYTMQGGGVTWPNSVYYDNIHAVAVPEASAISLVAVALLIGTGVRCSRSSDCQSDAS